MKSSIKCHAQGHHSVQRACYFISFSSPDCSLRAVVLSLYIIPSVVFYFRSKWLLFECMEQYNVKVSCSLIQALQALGYVAGGDGDQDSLSADERSDGEGKNDRLSTSSSCNSVTSTDAHEVKTNVFVCAHLHT